MLRYVTVCKISNLAEHAGYNLWTLVQSVEENKIRILKCNTVGIINSKFVACQKRNWISCPQFCNAVFHFFIA
jgi:hypothetical protein